MEKYGGVLNCFGKMSLVALEQSSVYCFNLVEERVQSIVLETKAVEQDNTSVTATSNLFQWASILFFTDK